jgi:signal transduction histidine kinase
VAGVALAAAPNTVAVHVVGRLVVVGPSTAHAARAAERVATTLAVTLRIAHGREQVGRAHRRALDAARDEITEKSARLHGAVDRLTELDRAKSNFLATISHELRTPLTSIIGYSEMLAEGMAGPVSREQRDYLETILAKSEHLLQIITGILEVARMESGVLRVARVPIAITELIHGVAATLSSEADRRSIAVRLPVAPVPRVLGDGRKLRQVLTQLLSNALKFTPQGGGVEVDAVVGPLFPTGDRAFAGIGVRVSVHDTGIGIPPSALAHIFEPFYQVDQSSTRPFGGTGLGLSLARSYVEAHGGRIWVDSRPGEGSTFTVSLPVVPEDLEALGAASG